MCTKVYIIIGEAVNATSGLVKFFDKEENTCLVGDLNFDTSKTNDLTRYLSRLQFKQLVGRATQLDGHILDQVYVPETLSNQVVSGTKLCFPLYSFMA